MADTPGGSPADSAVGMRGGDAPPMFVCPYCGGATRDVPRCDSCKGFLDPLSRQASQNVMGPWFIRDEVAPFRPGCSFETLVMLVRRGKVTGETILRGPSTNQFWMPARRVPGLAHKLGLCHACGGDSEPEDEICGECGVEFVIRGDRQTLGLLPVRPVPGQTGVTPEAEGSGRATEPDKAIGSDTNARRRVAVLESQLRVLWVVTVVMGVLAAAGLGLAAAAMVYAGGGGGMSGGGRTGVEGASPGTSVRATSPGSEAVGVRPAGAETAAADGAGGPMPQTDPAKAVTDDVMEDEAEGEQEPAPAETPSAEPKPSGGEVESAAVTEAERLLALDTTASIRRAIAVLEQAGDSDRVKRLLAGAKAALAQKELRGVR